MTRTFASKDRPKYKLKQYFKQLTPDILWLNIYIKQTGHHLEKTLGITLSANDIL